MGPFETTPILVELSAAGEVVVDLLADSAIAAAMESGGHGSVGAVGHPAPAVVTAVRSTLPSQSVWVAKAAAPGHRAATMHRYGGSVSLILQAKPPRSRERYRGFARVRRRMVRRRAETALPRTDKGWRETTAPEKVHPALVDPEALTAWLPPAGMTGKIERFDLRPGGPVEWF